MQLQDNLNVLQGHEAFAGLVREVVTMREDCIKELHSADIDRLSQISGKILAYDEIIGLCGWDSLIKRFPDS
jgi:hypothetical protein|tara:strand:- start:421 stop:636 length:216 start_codon:yes stop_codon:yes gene_type:complete